MSFRDWAKLTWWPIQSITDVTVDAESSGVVEVAAVGASALADADALAVVAAVEGGVAAVEPACPVMMCWTPKSSGVLLIAHSDLGLLLCLHCGLLCPVLPQQ